MRFIKNLFPTTGFGLIVALMPVYAVAQTSIRPVRQFTSAQIDSASSSKKTPDKPGRLLATGPSDERYLIVVRTGEGAVEAHEQYDDVAVVRAGRGVLRTGPKVEGAKVSGTAPTRE